ncbi:hypothetical protein PCASD_17222 [Puccinia coronata f. sp. avenae]|uniref:Vacuolar protein sorting-associated protein 28 n=2 Tax=Puccinia TaxID=5296 RepID=A0A2N5T2X6_9BASI|nr:hypothetical protein PCASD_17222 [Puccinia coronata f. sp. avenae]
MPDLGSRGSGNFGRWMKLRAAEYELENFYTLEMPLNLDEEFKLYSTNAEREKYDNQATLYSIILSLEYLERAYVRDSITQAQYVALRKLRLSHITSPPFLWLVAQIAAPPCGRLLGHFKTLLNLVGGDLQWVQNFMMEYRAAANRIRVGVPATVEHSSEESNESSKASRGVAETTQNFITFMDALKLKMRAKDQLHPLLSELMVGYSKFPKSQEWEGRPKILHWLITLNSMRASDEITDEQSRQVSFLIQLLEDKNDNGEMAGHAYLTLSITNFNNNQILFDIDSAYQEFYKSLT